MQIWCKACGSIIDLPGDQDASRAACPSCGVRQDAPVSWVPVADAADFQYVLSGIKYGGIYFGKHQRTSQLVLETFECPGETPIGHYEKPGLLARSIKEACLFTNVACHYKTEGETGRFAYSDVASVGDDLAVGLKDGRRARLPDLPEANRSKLVELLGSITSADGYARWKTARDAGSAAEARLGLSGCLATIIGGAAYVVFRYFVWARESYGGLYASIVGVVLAAGLTGVIYALLPGGRRGKVVKEADQED